MKYIDFDKKNIKPFSAIISFLLVLLLIVYLLSQFAFSADDEAKYARKDSNAYSFVLEPDNTIQVAAIGDSNTYSAIIPAVIWEEQGYTTTVIGSPGQLIDDSKEKMKRLYKTQSPKVILLEADMLFMTDPKEGNKPTLIQKDSPLKVFFDNANPKNSETLFENSFTLFKFHDRWKTLFGGKNVELEDPHSHGYHLNVTSYSFNPNNYMSPTENIEPIRQVEIDGVTDFCKYCESQGSTVIIVTVPTPLFWTYPRHNCIAQLADELGVEYLDFNLLWDELNLDSKTDFRDRMHLNYYGARKLSAYLGRYLKENCVLEDLRKNEDYAFWDTSVTLFYEDVKNAENQENKKHAISNV